MNNCTRGSETCRFCRNFTCPLYQNNIFEYRDSEAKAKKEAEQRVNNTAYVMSILTNENDRAMNNAVRNRKEAEQVMKDEKKIKTNRDHEIETLARMTKDECNLYHVNYDACKHCIGYCGKGIPERGRIPQYICIENQKKWYDSEYKEPMTKDKALQIYMDFRAEILKIPFGIETIRSFCDAVDYLTNLKEVQK